MHMHMHMSRDAGTPACLPRGVEFGGWASCCPTRVEMVCPPSLTAGVDADSEAETPRAAAAAAVAAVCAAAAPSTSLPVALPASVKME